MRRRATRTSPDREGAKAELRAMLEEAAANRTTVTYGEVAVRVFGGRVPARSRHIMDVLFEVDAEEEARSGLVIASLVVRSDSGIPGVGYFTFLADRLGKDVSDPVAAWQLEAERVWDAYAGTRE